MPAPANGEPMMRRFSRWAAGVAAGACLVMAQPAAAQLWLPDSGRLVATGGVTALDGTGGGGLATWALITGYGTRDSVGGNAHVTYVPLSNYTVGTAGAAIGLFDRVEVSYNHLVFDTGGTGARLGLGRNFRFEQDGVGVKVRLFGDAVYDQDRFLPQVSIGALYRTTDQGQVLKAIGARDRDGTDFYIAATKLFLDQSILVNTTLRFTRANQFGILGFGGDRSNAYHAEFEGALAYLPTRSTAIGAEYRTRPNNLGFAREQNAFDIFAAWFPTKNISLTLAYVNLGDVATVRNQQGVYLSAQIGF